MPYKDTPASGCKDVFHAALVSNAEFVGQMELPRIRSQAYPKRPQRLIRFSDSIGSSDSTAMVHFYEHDCKIERIWNAPQNYLAALGKYSAVISPDFSLYRDMPLAMQIWNTYRDRAIGNWLQENGVHVVPNVRWGDERSYSFCFDGLDTGGIVAIGSHGCIKHTDDKMFFLDGLQEMIRRLRPCTIIVYGATPDSLFHCCGEAGIEIWQYDSVFCVSHRKEAC